MAEQIPDLIKSISDMSTDELMEHVRKIRTRKYIERPAKKKRIKAETKKKTKSKINKLNSLLDKMSPADREALLKSMKGDKDAT